MPVVLRRCLKTSTSAEPTSLRTYSCLFKVSLKNTVHCDRYWSSKQQQQTHSIAVSPGQYRWCNVGETIQVRQPRWDNPGEPVPENDSPILDFLMIRGWSLELCHVASHCMTGSWLAAATWMRAKELTVSSQDVTQDAIPTTTLPIYRGLGPADSLLDCTLWGLDAHFRSVKIHINHSVFLCGSQEVLLTLTPCADPVLKTSSRHASRCVTETLHWRWSDKQRSPRFYTEWPS